MFNHFINASSVTRNGYDWSGDTEYVPDSFQLLVPEMRSVGGEDVLEWAINKQFAAP